MSRKNGEWTIHESAEQFKNDFLTVVEDKVTQPDGKPGSFASVKLKPGVNVLPIDDEMNVYLTRQFRYAIGRESLEVVCGGLDEADALEGAKREAREELGIAADDWQFLGTLDMDTSIVNSPTHSFIARKLEFIEKDQDATEDVKTVKMPLAEAVEKVISNKITHAPSAVLLLKAWHKLKA